MTADDAAEVRRIYADGIATGVATLEADPPEWEPFDRAHRSDCRFVARDRPGGPVLGWCALGSYSSRARVSRGRLGKRLRRAPTRAAGVSVVPCSRSSSRHPKSAGIWTLWAGVIAENAASLALHERVGFRRVGVQDRIGQDAHGRWRDVVLLQRRSEIVGR